MNALNHLSEFEILTLMAALYFHDEWTAQNIDICVIEVGLGGTLDTTNLFNTTALSLHILIWIMLKF